MDLNEEVVQQEYQSSFSSVLTQAPVSPGAMEKARLILYSMDESSRLDAIVQALPVISEYNYEVLQFLMEQRDLLEDNKSNKKNLELLKLLKEYKRIFPPTSFEEETVSSLNPSDVFSSFSSFTNTSNVTSSAAAALAKMGVWERQQQLVRLPFRLIQGKKMGKIMEAELTSATLPAWQLITSSLGSPKDRILLSLATKLVTSFIKTHNNSGSVVGDNSNDANNGSSHCQTDHNGVITKEFENLLQEISPILMQMERRENGIWLCQVTADKLSGIGNKVMALENGLNYARMWVEECNSLDSASNSADKIKAENAAKMFESKILPLSTQWALIRGSLGSREELIPLVNQPEQLIRHLYHLPLKSFDEKVRSGKENEDSICLDKFTDRKERMSYDESVIHSICEDIADLHDLDLLTIQTTLIDLWLTGSDPSSSTSNDSEHTVFNVTTDFNLDCDVVNEEESIPRIISMLKSFNGPSHAEHLLKILFSDKDDDVTIQQIQSNITLNSRRSAIFCLSKTGHAGPELEQELNILNQLIYLQTFGVSLTPEMYDQLEKLPMLLRLWEKYKGRQTAGPLVARLLLDLSLNTGSSSTLVPPQLWNSVLLQMIKCNQKTVLRPVMMAIMRARGLEKVRQTDGFIQAKAMQ